MIGRLFLPGFLYDLKCCKKANASAAYLHLLVHLLFVTSVEKTRRQQVPELEWVLTLCVCIGVSHERIN